MKADNTLIISALCAAYAAHCAADAIVCGFDIGGTVFFAEIPKDIFLDAFVGVSMTSDEIPCKRLRVKPLTKKTTALFNSFSPDILCTFAELTERAQNDFSGNRGEAFEAMLCEYYNGTKSAPNAAFWQDGDFTKPDGEKVQAKFQNASVIHEKHLEALKMLK